MENDRTQSLLMKEGPTKGESYSLNRPETVLGREPGVDLRIDSPGISRKHARISLQDKLAYIEDLGSSNGTFVNGERLTQARLLQSGDRIGLGQSVVLEYHGGQAPVSATMLEGTAPGLAGTMIEGLPVQVGQTMIGEEPLVRKKTAPAQLIVSIAGETMQTYPLTQARVTIGRAEDNLIVIRSPIVSRLHAHLEKLPGGYRVVVETGARNPVLFEGRPLLAPRLLQHGDTLRIGSADPGMMVTLTYIDPSQAVESQANPIRFGEKNLVTFGRDPANDVVLDSPNVSRFHAHVERVGQRYRLVDLHSANGTFVNEQRVEGETWLQAEDEVRIGRHRFRVGRDELDLFEEARGLSVDAINLNKWVRKDLNILKNISVAFQPREFIVVVGQSGGGKSTLVDAIAGYRPATHGMVLVNGENIYKNFEAVINDIGYVPQRDIIHYELSVYQALDYAARLRMPRDTSKEERHKRILEVLEDLDMAERKDTPISKLSGGQIKRVSIGVELLTKPGLFFLDEPTSGLDPGTETSFMHLMRRLADQGRTIVMVTHATKNVMLADKVVFLARGGYLAWFGPPEEALKYFNQYRSEREQRSKEMDFDQIYSILDDPSRGSAQDWATRYLESPAYEKYVAAPLQKVQAGAESAKAGSGTGKAARPKAKRKSRASGLHQFFVLSARNLKILVRDRTSLVLMLLAPLLIAALDLVLAPLIGRDIFSYESGNAANIGTVLFLSAINGLLIGGFSQMREFVKESDIYKRERLVNLKILPYVASKVWIALLLAFYQAAAFTILRFISFDMPGGQTEMMLFYITMVLAILAGMMSGLLASALAPNASSAPLLMILLIVPQIVLSGALAPLPSQVSAIASTRWAFQSVMGISGFGSDVAADACWQLDESLRESMSLEDKQAYGCRCMGPAIFTPGSCNFPGLGRYYKAEVDQAPPQEPPALGEKPPEPEMPPEPVVPPAPEAPADQSDQLAMVKYFNALQGYQEEVRRIQDAYKEEARRIQDGYRAQMLDYENQARVYQDQMEQYQKDRLSYEGARATAINSAEAAINTYMEKYGWTYVNKNDPAIFWPWMLTAWGAQGIIILVYFGLILFIFKRKDV